MRRLGADVRPPRDVFHVAGSAGTHGSPDESGGSAVKPYFEPEAYEAAEREAYAYSYTFEQVIDRDNEIRDS